MGPKCPKSGNLDIWDIWDIWDICPRLTLFEGLGRNSTGPMFLAF